ncbi:adhesion G-protein coupled receptor G7-like [Clavelina lepadiformis]|uniref:adhesion G-protein coupled receptor G7-like n=1 Tax=Clavelina lepadiformis TaxID=159417 RepID=UPI004041B185
MSNRMLSTLTLTLNATDWMEICFYYLSYWQDSGVFNLIGKSADEEKVIWSAKSDQECWQEVSVPINPNTSALIFQSDGLAIVFLDDIRLIARGRSQSNNSVMETRTTTTKLLNTLSTLEIISQCSFNNRKLIELESIVSSATSLTAEVSTGVIKDVACLVLSGNNFSKIVKLLRLLDQVADKVHVNDGEVFIATSPTVFMAVVNFPEASSKNIGNTSGVGLKVVNYPKKETGFGNDSFSLFYENDITNHSSIFVPYEVIKKSKDGKVSFYSFFGDRWFYTIPSVNKIKEMEGYKESFVNSHVVLSATILDPRTPTNNLKEKMQISFRINKSSSIFGSSFCGFWVEDGSYWSSEGCTKLSLSEQLLRCECNHLTNFASLFAYGNLTHDKGLDILTYVGCSISAIASLFTIIALLIIWKSIRVQMRQSTKFVMLNLSFSLFLLNILILISEIPGVRSDEGKCKALAGTLHFALISAFLWMFAQAVYVFISINKPIFFKATFSSKKFIISFIFLAWGLPIVLVVLVATLKPEWYVNQANDVNPDKTPNIQGQFRCWIVPDMMLYLVIIPAAILLSFNLFLCVWTIISFFLNKRPGEKVILRKNQVKDLERRLKRCAILFVIFGITWIFGFLIFNSSDVSLAFAYIFTIFNSLQGFALFILFIVCNKAVRDNVLERLHLPSRSLVTSKIKVPKERKTSSKINAARE